MLIQVFTLFAVVAALGAFLISSLQISLRWRVIALAIGAACIATAIAISVSIDRSGIFDIELREWPAIFEALALNLGSVQPALSTVLDLSIVITVVLGFLTAWALTPGDAVERLIRPIKKGMIGAIIGSIVTLLVVSLGFGAQYSPNAFIGEATAENVTDGDTIRIGAASLRLWGIDAPEDDQECLGRGGSGYRCGDASRQALVQLIEGKVVRCWAPDPTCKNPDPRADRPLRHSFGRPIVSCFIQEDDKNIDIAKRMAKLGHAAVFMDDGREKSCYKKQVQSAQSARIGMWDGVTIHPSDWRKNDGCRERLESWPAQLGNLVDCSLPLVANDN